MKEEEEEALLEDLCVRRNRFARERHAPSLKKINMILKNEGTSQCPKVMGTH
jgi:hypothetical protein